jgi:hypothetical protein
MKKYKGVNNMRSHVRMLIWVAQFFVTIFPGCNREGGTISGPGAESGSPIEIAIDQLIGEYDSNVLLANQKYRGRWVKLEGEVVAVSVLGKDSEGRPKQVGVSILSPKWADKKWAVGCILVPEHHERALRLTVGDRVKVIGKCREAEPDVTGRGENSPTVRLIVLRESELLELDD